MSLEQCTDIYGPEFWKIRDEEGETWSVSDKLACNLLMLLYWTKKYKGDIVIFVDGREGSGKSTMARQLAKMLSPDFTEKNIFYTFAQLKHFYFNEIEWEVGIYDESDEGVDRREGPKKINIEFAKFMRQSRQAHKILIMCGPSIYDIASYVAQHRVSCLIHCYKESNIHPGHFMFFNEEKIHKLFVYDKSEREYRQTPNFTGTFPKGDIVNMEAYNLKKKHAFFKFKDSGKLDQYLTPEEIILGFLKSRIISFEKARTKSKGLTVKDFCAAFDISREHFYNLVEKLGVQVQEKPEEELESRGAKSKATVALPNVS